MSSSQVLPPKTDVVLQRFDYGGKVDLSRAIGIQKENVGNYAFFRDN